MSDAVGRANEWAWRFGQERERATAQASRDAGRGHSAYLRALIDTPRTDPVRPAPVGASEEP